MFVPATFQAFAILQDTTGWQRFLDGIIAKECAYLQQTYAAVKVN